jgi:hypothetical protein
MSALRSFASLLGFASALGLVVGCSSSSSSPDNGAGPSEAGNDAAAADAPSTVDAPSYATDAPSDADVCSAPMVLRFETAGCGASAHPVCGSSDQDACAMAVCGCDGTTLVKCDYASAPWSHLGPCTPADASSDAPEQ